MYFIPMGLLLKDEDAAVEASGLASDELANLTWADFIVANLVPVTLGNIIGGPSSWAPSTGSCSCGRD